jgi:hypothetical protein
MLWDDGLKRVVAREKARTVKENARLAWRMRIWRFGYDEGDSFTEG